MILETNRPEVLRLVVVFLRFHARMNQVELGQAAGMSQADISRYEAGSKTLSDEALRRLAAAAGLAWPLVVHLRSFIASLLSAAPGGVGVEDAELLDAATLGGPARLAIQSYLAEEAARAFREPDQEARKASARGNDDCSSPEIPRQPPKLG